MGFVETVKENVVAALTAVGTVGAVAAAAITMVVIAGINKKRTGEFRLVSNATAQVAAKDVAKK